MRMFRYVAPLLVAWALAAVPLAAQDQPAADPLAALRAKEALSAEEAQALRTWLEERVGTILDADAASATPALRQVRDGYRGSAGFKKAYLDACVELAGPALANAKLVPATQLVTLLHQFGEADVYPVLIDGLKDKRTAVRTAAAVGLRDLRVKLALKGGTAATDVLNALRDAGQHETSSVALELIYRAMNYAELPNPPDAKTLIPIVLDLLEARAKQYASGPLSAEAADRDGLALGGALRKSMSDTERNRFVAVLGQVLKYAVTRATDPERPLVGVKDKGSSPHLIELRNRTELLIAEAEKQLTELLTPKEPPTITSRMQANRRPEMKIEMNKWADLIKPVVGREFYMDLPAEPVESEETGNGG